LSILCCDYKILTRVLSLRIITVLPDNDPSYCVPCRHIRENVRFIFNATSYDNQETIPLILFLSIKKMRLIEFIMAIYLKNLKVWG
jgi:hypothetical protein